jgi:hypothetical protein
MIVVACAAPDCSLEPAPITSLPAASLVGNTALSAFWGGDDAYYLTVPATNEGEEARWFRIDSGEVLSVEDNHEERVALGKLMADITPIGGGRVAFPVGSSGRRVYRVWRTGAAANGGKTRILEVRAARSRRQPA